MTLDDFTTDPALRERLVELAPLARSGMPILIAGPSGSGKEHLAKLIHYFSDRKPFVAQNCAAIPETLAESFIFGSVKGAFTGAIERQGLIEAAHQGTLFLDEIHALDPRVQMKFLRVLQEKKVARLGSLQLRAVDFRLVSATTKDLRSLVAEGMFDEALSWRIGIEDAFVLPPLAKRRTDVPFLIEKFWRRADGEVGARNELWEPEAVELMKRADWPGNIRQLERFVTRLKVLHPPGPVTRDVVLRFELNTGIPGLDKLSTFTQRAQHLIFYPAALVALGCASKTEANQRVQLAVLSDSPQLFAPDARKASGEVRQMWRDHRYTCPMCRGLWAKWGEPA
jgi:transcriptional regulator with PAS, ATPase and Fis domain